MIVAKNKKYSFSANDLPMTDPFSSTKRNHPFVALKQAVFIKKSLGFELVGIFKVVGISHDALKASEYAGALWQDVPVNLHLL